LGCSKRRDRISTLKSTHYYLGKISMKMLGSLKQQKEIRKEIKEKGKFRIDFL
jgi:hypothetical protein